MAKRILSRQLLHADGVPRIAVEVELINVDTQKRVDMETTDKDGRFNIDTSYISGFFELRYYGDGIAKTIRDVDGYLISEDPVTPWELNIELSIFADTEPPEAPLWDTPAIVVNDNGTLILHWLEAVDNGSGVDGYRIFRALPEEYYRGEGTFNTTPDIYSDAESPEWVDDEHNNRWLVCYSSTGGSAGGYKTYGIVDTLNGNELELNSADLATHGDPEDGQYSIISEAVPTLPVQSPPSLGDYTLVDTVDEFTLEYIDENLYNRRIYYYVLTAFDKAGNEGNYSIAESEITKDTIPPGICLNIKALAFGQGRVDIVWDPPIQDPPEPLTYNVIYCDLPDPLPAENLLVWKDPSTPTFYGTSTGVGAGTLTDNTKTWTVDEHEGKTLIDSASNEFTIDSNISDTLTVSGGNPVAGQYYIVGDQIVIDGTSGDEDDMATTHITGYIDFGVTLVAAELIKRLYLVRAIDDANNYGPWQMVYADPYVGNVEIGPDYQPGDGIPPFPPTLLYAESDVSGRVRLIWKAPVTGSLEDKSDYRIFRRLNTSADEWISLMMHPAIKFDHRDSQQWPSATSGGIGGYGSEGGIEFKVSGAGWEGGEKRIDTFKADTDALYNVTQGGEYAYWTLKDDDGNKFVIRANNTNTLFILPGQGIPVNGGYTLIPDEQVTILATISDGGEYRFKMRLIDKSGMVSADSNELIVDVFDNEAPIAPSKPEARGVLGGILVYWSDVPDWGLLNTKNLNAQGYVVVYCTSTGIGGTWATGQWIGYILVDSENNRIQILDNGNSSLTLATKNLGLIELGPYAIMKENILFNYEYKYELWRSPYDSGWKTSTKNEDVYHPVTNNCELIARIFLTKNGYYYTQYRDYDFISDGSIPLEATAWNSVSGDTLDSPYLADDGDQAGYVYYAVKAIDQNDLSSLWSDVSDGAKANILFERYVEPILALTFDNFIFIGKDLSGYDSDLFTPIIIDDPYKIVVPMGIINIKTHDRFAEDVEIYWRKWDGNDRDHIPVIRHAPFSVHNASFENGRETKTVEYPVMLNGTLKGQSYEFKMRVLDLYGNKSKWHPSTTQVIDSGTSTAVGSDWLQDTTENWTTNIHAGRMLVDSNGSEYKVVSNTSNTLTIRAGGFSPVSGSYKIVQDMWFIVTCGDIIGPFPPIIKVKLAHSGRGDFYP